MLESKILLPGTINVPSLNQTENVKHKIIRKVVMSVPMKNGRHVRVGDLKTIGHNV
jgi:hypothetical protein